MERDPTDKKKDSRGHSDSNKGKMRERVRVASKATTKTSSRKHRVAFFFMRANNPETRRDMPRRRLSSSIWYDCFIGHIIICGFCVFYREQEQARRKKLFWTLFERVHWASQRDGFAQSGKKEKEDYTKLEKGRRTVQLLGDEKKDEKILERGTRS